MQPLLEIIPLKNCVTGEDEIVNFRLVVAKDSRSTKKRLAVGGLAWRGEATDGRHRVRRSEQLFSESYFRVFESAFW